MVLKSCAAASSFARAGTCQEALLYMVLETTSTKST